MRACGPGGRWAWGCRGGGGRRAFTLIEIAISVALMALILVAAYACLSAGLSAQRLLDPRLEAVQSARVALALITADLRAACPLAADTELVGLDRMIGEIEADNLDFATLHHTPTREGEGDYCEMSYYLDREEGGEGWALWRRRNPRIGLDPFSGGVKEEIVRGVSQLKFEYYDGFDWYDRWGDAEEQRRAAGSGRLRSNTGGLPEAVRITLAFAAVGLTAGRGQAVPGAEGQADLPRDSLVFRTVARINVPSAAGDGGSAGGGSSSGTGSGDAAAGSATVGGATGPGGNE